MKKILSKEEFIDVCTQYIPYYNRECLTWDSIISKKTFSEESLSSLYELYRENKDFAEGIYDYSPKEVAEFYIDSWFECDTKTKNKIIKELVDMENNYYKSCGHSDRISSKDVSDMLYVVGALYKIKSKWIINAEYIMEKFIENPSGLDFSLPYTGAACEWEYISKSQI